MHHPGCELCEGDGGELIVRREKWRLVRITGADGDAYRGFCRVVWNEHVKELTDLSSADRQIFMEAVFALESVLREALQPEKMNVASLGNLTRMRVVRPAPIPALRRRGWMRIFQAVYQGWRAAT